MRVGFIGLGNIGAPMARRLLRPEFELTVHDNHAAALQPFEGTPARVTRSCVELARSSEVIAVCVRDDVELLAVAYGDASLSDSIEPGTTAFICVVSLRYLIRFPLSFLTKLVLEQLRQLGDRLVRVGTFRLDPQRRPLRRGEDDHLHHALTIGFGRLVASLVHHDFGLKLVGRIHELHRRPRVQAERVADDDVP